MIEFQVVIEYRKNGLTYRPDKKIRTFKQRKKAEEFAQSYNNSGVLFAYAKVIEKTVIDLYRDFCEKNRLVETEATASAFCELFLRKDTKQNQKDISRIYKYIECGA